MLEILNRSSHGIHRAPFDSYHALQAQKRLEVVERKRKGSGEVVATLRVSAEPHVRREIERLFVARGWGKRAGRALHLTEAGRFIVDGMQSTVRTVARDVRARVADYGFAAEDDPRAAERELGTFAFRWFLATVQRMGVMREAGEQYDLDALQERLGVAPKYRRYFEALTRRLQSEGLVVLQGTRVETTPLVRGYALTAVDEQVAEFKQSFAQRYPGAVGLLNWATTSLGRYDEILTGRIDVTEVVFKDGDMSVFGEVFGGDVVAEYFNRIVADATREAVVRLKDTTPKVRILEIGAGTGGTTAGVLEALQPFAGSVEFCFTDISRSFVRHGKRRFGEQPWIEYRALNIEEDLAGQGFEPRRYDVVIAANVLHDTRDIAHTLAQTRTLLKPGGLLVLNEFTVAKACLSFAGALLHGYWLFEDPERRLPDTCLLSVPMWSAALASSGFAMVEAFALPTQSTAEECSQSVMLCEAAMEAAKPMHAESTAAREANTVSALVEQETLGLLGADRAAAYAPQRPLMDMGLDSMELVELKTLLEQHAGVKLTPKFLFEHETPEKLAAALSGLISDGQVPPVAEKPRSVAEPVETADAVAIVGISCRFPGGAVSPERFWELLESGRNGIVPMPEGRWRWPSYIDLGGKHRGIDKAGFLERIDEFDAPFFRVSGKEAELMDPQQRLLLELSWEAMEDAGHRPSELSGRKIGVFVGVCHSDYREVLNAALDSAESYLGTGSAHSLLANRLSFFYDFKGPSLAVDTACSSSLVALHDAVTTLRRGECEQALVGAVNLLCSPTISVTYYEAGMLSPTGTCNTFDAKANGYVRGEGGAMLLLKPLRTALADGDAIYGLVTGTAVNHGGQAASLTAPKPEAQATVIEAAWQAADVPMDSVGYIEAHGTGTRLGDPIEIGGLTEAFRRVYRTRGEAWPASPYCGLGSVKTVVGHLEAAAGLAGVLKILLAMQHGSIPATRNFEKLNPEIDLTDSPFRIVAQNEAWPARGGQPRRAGVSSFGFGGSNSHAVIEEYPRSAEEARTADGEYLIPLSARSEAQLIEQAKRLLAFLESSPNLADVAYTLQVGREAMEERLAIIAESREELAASLRAYVAGDRTDPSCYRGQAPKTRVTTPRQESEDLPTLASLWVKGAEIDWARIAGSGRRTHLPTYPFARQRYWVTEQPRARKSVEAQLHPLVHRNTSDLREQRFSSTFTGEEFFLAGHRIGGRRVLPGVAYVEMAREAVARAAGVTEAGRIAVRNVVWLRPVAVGQDPLEVHIGLFPKEEGEIGFEVFSGAPGSPDEVVHARGVAAVRAAAKAPRLDVQALARKYEQRDYAADAFYDAFARIGFDYKAEHCAVAGLRVEDDEIVARLSLPATASIGSFVLHPGLVDSGVQASFAFALDAGEMNANLPFELRSAEIYGACTPEMWAVVRRTASAGVGVERHDIDLCDDAGSVCVRLSGLALRSMEAGKEKPAEMQPELPGAAVDDGMSRRVQAALTQVLLRLVKVKAEEVRPASEFGDLGFDSIAYIELVDQLLETYGLDLDPTVFFEHRTLERFTRHLLQAHGEVMARHFGRPGEAAPAPPSAPKEAPAEKRQRTRFIAAAPEAAPEAAPPRPAPAVGPEPIAIVGMSGRFPMAADVDELWANLLSGRDCIREIPADRWDWRSVWGDPAEHNKTNVKWGGFMDGVYEFDPQFFNISPREATLMDPHQRLLMMYVWKAIEDAGYSPSQLSGSNTAIFFATGISDYGRVIARSATSIDAYVATGTVTSVGPNRMSYYLDLHGPSDPIETACSSSLVAMHRAVAAMRSGECEMAIVGGVNTMLTPDLHISFTKAGMLSEDGRCKTFSADANGYVRSEGVAALLLKPLRAAEEAGDHIYGLIVGSAENHGGRANTLTSPNPQAQAALLERAYGEAGVDPSSVSYIEAHGTGTALGDPLEIEGLKSAFSGLYRSRNTPVVAGHCGVGSVKSNIGHLELAAGIAGVIKVLLQMKHKTLVPTLHCDTINPYIRLEESPFYVVREMAEWGPGSGDGPRRAGVSSFGFGGSNAHVVLEEYVPPAGRALAATSPSRQAIVLSARAPERLREQAEQLLAALRERRLADVDLADVAYTLQVGRVAMDERLGLLVSSALELEEKLQAFLDGAPQLHRGRVQKGGDGVLTTLAADEAFQNAVATWVEQGRLEMLLDLWIKGLDVDWSKLHGGAGRRRVSLPTYPFARDRYAIETAAWGQAPARATEATVAAVLHPLLHSNTSDLREQRYSSQFTGEEFFFAGSQPLPAVHLEMARAAIERAFPAPDESAVLELQQMVWAQPIAAGKDKLVEIALTAADEDRVEYEIYTRDGGAEVIHCQGRAAWRSRTPGNVAPQHVQEQVTPLRLAEGLTATAGEYVLHPSLLDGALRASLEVAGPGSSLAAVETLRVLAPCTREMSARVRHTPASGKLDVDLCDGRGTVCVEMRGVTWRQAAVEAADKTVAVVEPVVVAGAPARREVVLQMPVERMKRSAISLAAPGAAATAPAASGRAPISLANTPAAPAVSTVRLYDDGDGIFSIDVASSSASEAVEGLRQALERGRQEPSLKVLLLGGLERVLGRGGRADYNYAVEQQLYRAIVSFPSPTIAVLRGAASGAAFLAASVCDLMVLSEEGTYGYTDPGAGFHPTAAEASLLGARFGERQAQDFLYLSATSTGRELRARGWTCPVVPAAQVEAHARKLASTLAAKLPETLRVVKHHLVREIAPLVDALTPVEAAVAEPVGTSGAAVRVVRFADLRDALTAGTDCRAVVLSGGIPNEIADDVMADVQRLLLESDVPVVAALSGATGHAWLVGQLCDACVYSREGVFSSAGVGPKSAAAVFADRLGTDAAAEVLLTGDGHTGAELHRRAGTVLVAEDGDVVAAAVRVAEWWATLPRTTLASWKKQTAARFQSKIDAHPAAAPAGAEETYAAPAAVGMIPLRSEVVTVTAHDDGVVVVKMEDRQAKNAFSDAVIEGLNEAFAHIHQTPGYKVVVLTGYDQYFTSGGTKEILLGVQSGRLRFTEINVWQLPLDCKLPVIAAMQGHGIGGGWALGMFADLVLLSEESRYWNPYVEYGFSPGDGATWVFPRTLGYDLGAETMLTAQHFSGSELRERGLRQCIVPRAEVVPSAMALARRIARTARPRLLELKRHLTAGLHEPLEEAYRLELEMHDKTIVGHADALARIESNYYQGSEAPAAPQESAAAGVVDSNDLAAVAAEIRTLLANELQMSEADIDDDAQFVNFGLDSIAGVTWVRKINLKYQTSIAATTIYSYPTLTQFSGYVAEEAQRHGALPAKMPQESAVAVAVDGHDLAAVATEIRALLANELQMSEAEIDDEAQFVNFGLDSIAGVSWVRKINLKYQTSIAATTIYSYPTLTQFSRYVADEAQKAGVLPARAATPAVVQKPAAKTLSGKLTSRRRRAASARFAADAPAARQSQPIAVIGMAGQFAKSRNLEELWRNIADGRNCVEQVPPHRWDVDAYYRPGAIVPGKTVSQWMGALEEYDRFDPLFFSISPTEAESIDPQQRLFLQACWHAIENAGYDASRLSGSKCGVFVGSAFGDYHLLSREQQLSAESFTGDAASILAARVSYLLNLRGPSLSIDTACSSSLVALAQACDSLISGNSDMVLAGGVYVTAGPEMHVRTSQAGMLSPDGRCFTFDQRANGLVLGEGVGVLVLKRLADAERDGDFIQAVIEGWGTNQDGKTNGITAPNAAAQADLEREVYDRYQVDPATIQLIEAHGTGTKLGDPIEVEGLKTAFKKYTRETGYCALGSVKSNIGHCAQAAGIAAVLKVILALKNKKLPPTINFERLNEHIDLTGSPFYVNTRLQEWTPAGVARRGAVSSFGFSGTNAHAVIGEYVPPSEVARPVFANPSVLVPLSARTAEQLREKAADLLAFLRRQAPPVDLQDVGYTLQVGRAPMDERLGFVVRSVDQLAERLEAYLAGERPIPDFQQGHARQGRKLSKDDAKALVERAIAEQNPGKLLELWVNGAKLDWNELHGDVKPQRIALPVYPFAKERYWIEAAPAERVATGPVAQVMHPLLHGDTSDARQQRYTSTFTGEEFFFAEHVIRTDGHTDQRVLPGVACLEMARAAIEQAFPARPESSVLELRGTVWMQPIVAGTTKQVSVVLLARDGGQIEYEIHSQDGERDVVHCQGRAVLSSEAMPERVDLEQLRRRLVQHKLEQSDVYATIARMGIFHGPSFRAVTAVQYGDGQSLARLSLPDAVANTWGDYVLHPSIMDAALQAHIVLIDGWSEAAQPRIPFALESLRILAPCSRDMVAWVRHTEGSHGASRSAKLDVDLCDERGNVCVQIRGFSPRLIGKEQKSSGSVLAAPVWRPSAVQLSAEAAERYVILCELPSVSAEKLESLVPRSVCTSLRAGDDRNVAQRYTDAAVGCFEQIQAILQAKPEAPVAVQAVVADGPEQALFAGLSGLLKTAAMENPRIAGQLLLVPPAIAAEELATYLRAERPDGRDTLVRYEGGIRQVARWDALPAATTTTPVAFKDNGVYLITGGLGAVGALFATEIFARTRNARVVLTGRSARSAATGQASYRQVDLDDLSAVEQLIASIQEEHGRLDGILHCAGMIADNFIVKKASAEFRGVLAPKVTGTVNLDLASRDVELDFFVLFSSIAGAFGNVGQADYATANGFMDRFAAYRNQQVAAKQRSGRTRSINWPLWAAGGMRIDPTSQELLERMTGIQPMSTEAGLQAFYRSLTLPHDQVLVMEGDVAQIRRYLLLDGADPVQPQIEDAAAAVDAQTLAVKTRDYLRRELAGVFKLAAEKIDPSEPLEKYGVDSILAMKLTSRLEQTFGSLSKTLFFEYQTLGELTKYFLRAHAARLTALFAPAENAVRRPVPAEATPLVAARVDRQQAPAVAPSMHDEPIAIVGLSGRYPGAPDVESYWNVLREGNDCITEIPKDRWDWQQYFSEARGEIGRHYSKWGGFIEGVDEFDALFFNISPKEARAIDPQERLFLQHAWIAVEDAGYTRAGLRMPHEGDLPGQVGVYAGVWCSEYQLLGAQASEGGEGLGIAVSVGSIANRVSYALNLHGPSITIDTMCSSSLTAIHLACQDLKLGRTGMAIAGGVNVSIHPNKYLMLSAAQALASDGRCRSFGEGGDGYVPAEGVGVVVLKRLSDAERDGDHIYGLIRGSALNHGGKTNGYSVPNPQAQASAVGRALAESGIDARHVSYIETHGTGTKLGDPIEIAALQKAFQQYTGDTQFCSIGSVKSNIGHCESAAGTAGLTKILLQMRHQQLLPSLHAAELNSHIEFDRTPFTVNRELRPWERPVIDGTPLPRIAGISSFGAGGSNAHLIIEEYQAPAREPVALPSVAVVLSARTAEQLQQRAGDLLGFVRERRDTLDLASLAYTLQVGREAMDVRLGFVVGSVEQLIAKLEAHVSGDPAIEDAYQGDVKRNKEALAVFSDDTDLQLTVEKWIASRKLSRLLDLWAKGLDVEWTKLYDLAPQRVSLPTYPFARERYWIDVPKPVPVPEKAAAAEVLHPLLHSNVSDLQEQRYRTTLSGDEPFPPACLEMARAAVEHASPSMTALELRDVVWAGPGAGSKEVSIALQPGAGGEVEYEIYSQTGEQEIVHCQGRAVRSAETAPARLDLERLGRETGHNQLLARVRVPAGVEETASECVLRPALLSAALQECRALPGSSTSQWPSSLESVRIVAPMTDELFVWARVAPAGETLDVDLCDDRGNVCAQLRGLRWQHASIEAEAPVSVPASTHERREIVFTAAPAAPVVRKGTGTISLGVPSAPPLLQASAASERITLKDASRGVALTAIADVPPVKLYDDGNGTFTIEIARRSDDVSASLLAALDRLQQEPGIKALILSGLELAGAADDALLQAIATFPSPVIGALRGDAHGAAFLAAALCDFVVCNEDASYGYTDPQAHVYPTTAVMAICSERFGEVLTQALLFEPAALTGRQLREKGWTGPVVPADQVEPQARTLAASLATKSQESLRLLKHHLARRLSSLAGEPTRGETMLPDDASDHVPPSIESPASIHLDERAERVLAITFTAGDLHELVAQLDRIFARVDRDGYYKAVVLAGSGSEFLPDDVSEEIVADIQRVVGRLSIPVIAALAGNARGNAWLAAQFCDGGVYSSQGVYSANGIAQTAAAVFIQRFGSAAGREIVLTGADYAGDDLQRRVGAVHVTDRERVLPAAVQLAESWTSLPRRVLASWKKRSAALLVDRTRSSATESPRQDEAAEATGIATESVVFRSPVVTATAHPGGIVVVKMEDREAKNMFSDAFLDGVKQAFDHIARTPAYKVVVLTGYDGYFVSGGTKEGLVAIQQGKSKFTDSNIYHVALACELPVIAAVQGHAIGAGLAMGMFADVVLLGEESRYVSPYMGYGFTPGAGATYILPEMIGRDLAREGLLTAQHSTGSEWRDRGVRLNIMPRGEVVAAAMALARQIARASRRRLIGLKHELTAHIRQALDETYRLELAMHEQTFVGRSDTLALIEDTFHQQVEPEVPQQPVMETVAETADDDLLPSVSATLRSLLAGELLLRESDIDDHTQFVDLGLESISAVTWLKKINEKYRTSIDATKVYSHPTLAQLSRHVMLEAQKSGGLRTSAAPKPRQAATPLPATKSLPSQKAAATKPVAGRLVSRRKRAASRFATVASVAAPQSQAIAVVGMAGQFPQARNLDEFWQNLAEGKNCITQVPAERWDLQTYYQSGGTAPGKTNCQWLGALDEYDRFDPLFFNISPTEAENMDPQQRLFLQSCWHTIEHAGYDARALSGTRCGVFVGCGTSDYHDHSKADQLSAHVFTGSATSILAARISYFLNLQGPCVAIDTACSSSLVAIAQACDSLISGSSDVALAGGVYVMAGPSMHVMTAQAGMLSPEGKCFTFDQRADGFVPGEGVGVVMLKRLADAERDGDVVYGVIEGWGVNQDGKTNGITAPNPESQTRLEQDVYDRHGIDPSHIQLIEAHGTGTKLGDPIEVEGLKQAFRKYTERKEYCAIGSVKSNVGHCLMAAGVAGVIKVLLALQNKQLPPTINFERLNEHIDLADSPFYVNTRLQDWDLRGAQRRQAAISSFAFNGTNAHLVIGEHPRTVEVCRAHADAIVPLSARTAEQLREKAVDLLAFLRSRGSSVDLADVAYTLQVGRVPMDERLGFVASSVEQLADKLEAYVQGSLKAGEFHRDRVKRGGDESLNIIAQDEDVREAVVDKWIAKRKLARLLDLWVKGWDLDWKRIHGAAKPRRIALPVYPFAKERYWIDAASYKKTKAVTGITAAAIHPLLHRNTSDLSGQRYTSAFTGDEFFLADHRVRTHDGGPAKVLPGVAYLEMARAALEQASPDRQGLGAVELRNTAWLKPVVITEPSEISITLIPADDGHVDYEIYSLDGERHETAHCRGQAVLSPASAAVQLDLGRLTAEMTQGRLDAAEIYARFEKMGLHYGPAHQGVVAVHVGEGQVLAELRLSAAVEASEREYVLHPGLMDSALQASIGLLAGENRDRDKPRVPFMLESLHVVSACTAQMFAWVRNSPGAAPGAASKVDIDVCDPQGNVCVRMRGFATRDLEGHSGSPVHIAIPAAKLHIKKYESSFDRDFYKKLIADVANNVVTIDDAVLLK